MKRKKVSRIVCVILAVLMTAITFIGCHQLASSMIAGKYENTKNRNEHLEFTLSGKVSFYVDGVEDSVGTYKVSRISKNDKMRTISSVVTINFDSGGRYSELTGTRFLALWDDFTGDTIIFTIGDSSIEFESSITKNK